MSVNIGDPVQASDYNTLSNLIDDWFGAASLSWGDPMQTYGWGGSNMPSVNIGDPITAAGFNEMFDRINIAAAIVDSTASTLSRVTAGDIIRASHYNNIETQESIIRVARNTIKASEKSIHAGTTDTRTTSWSATITSTIRFDFDSMDNARYFFNSGGQLLLTLSLSGGSTGNALNWATLFSTLGTLSFSLDDTDISGSGGMASAIGYYDLTTGDQMILLASGTGAYTANNLTVEATRSADARYIELIVKLYDDHAGSVDGTTTLTAQYKKLDDQSSGSETLVINSPLVSVEDTFE